MDKRTIKAGWHILLAVAAIVEYRTSKSPLRRLLAGAAAGWHFAAAAQDWYDLEEGDKECLND